MAKLRMKKRTPRTARSSSSIMGAASKGQPMARPVDPSAILTRLGMMGRRPGGRRLVQRAI